ncbi:fungal hydrophobin [Polyporus arcularius HHB13444]|uniref:Hydrophobin n=1 Tax=Polyporus arcularius HHB13444 TaxID=1314778 RepID=A0A5C3NYR6_9APHY|nr:fungal hydrophobin [Polyporus arcularius HHB13444]
MLSSRALILAALPLLAVATAIQGRGGEPSSGATCCSTFGESSDPAIASQLGLLGIILNGVDVLVGLDCSPITVIGASSCSGTTVTCTDNSKDAAVDIGCVPITL